MHDGKVKDEGGIGVNGVKIGVIEIFNLYKYQRKLFAYQFFSATVKEKEKLDARVKKLIDEDDKKDRKIWRNIVMPKSKKYISFVNDKDLKKGDLVSFEIGSAEIIVDDRSITTNIAERVERHDRIDIDHIISDYGPMTIIAIVLMMAIFGSLHWLFFGQELFSFFSNESLLLDFSSENFSIKFLLLILFESIITFTTIGILAGDRTFLNAAIRGLELGLVLGFFALLSILLFCDLDLSCWDILLFLFFVAVTFTIAGGVLGHYLGRKRGDRYLYKKIEGMVVQRKRRQKESRKGKINGE